MTTISASLVKELRDKTGAGMMDCKAALTETKGHVEQAVDWRRQQGLPEGAHKAGRGAAEGLIGGVGKGKAGAPGRANLESDVVGPNAHLPDKGRQLTTLA